MGMGEVVPEPLLPGTAASGYARCQTWPGTTVAADRFPLSALALGQQRACEVVSRKPDAASNPSQAQQSMQMLPTTGAPHADGEHLMGPGREQRQKRRTHPLPQLPWAVSGPLLPYSSWGCFSTRLCQGYQWQWSGPSLCPCSLSSPSPSMAAAIPGLQLCLAPLPPMVRGAVSGMYLTPFSLSLDPTTGWFNKFI